MQYIYLVDQKLGFDPKFGICPNFWDLSQFLRFDPIFGPCNLLDKVKGKEVAFKIL